MGWRKRESLGRAIAREGGEILKEVAKGLFEIATFGMYPAKGWRKRSQRRSGKRPYSRRSGRR